MSDYLGPIVRGLFEVFEPLTAALEHSDQLQLFLLRHGWDARLDPGDAATIQGAFAILDGLEIAAEKLEELTDGSTDEAQAALELLQSLKPVITQLQTIDTIPNAGLPAPFDQQVLWDELAETLPQELLVLYLERRLPAMYALLVLFGIVRFERVSPSGAGRVDYERVNVDWGGITDLIAGRGDLFSSAYGWGDNFDHDLFMRTMERVCLALGLPAIRGLPRENLASANLDTAQIHAQGIRELAVPLVDEISPSDLSRWTIGGVVMPVPDPPGSATAPSGILFSPVLQGGGGLSLPLSRDVNLVLTGAFDGSEAVVARIYPRGIDVDASFDDLEIAAEIALVGAPEQPWILLGSENGHRFELDGFRVSVAARGALTDPEFLIAAGTGDSPNAFRVVLDFSEGDGFIQKTVDAPSFEFELSPNLIWSSKHGVTFEGQAGFEIALPVHLSLGPLEIGTIYIAARGVATSTETSLNTSVGVGLKAALGPLVLVVENIGASVKLVPRERGEEPGAFGNLDLALGFKPPNGVGLSIDAGVVKGGGYLYFDFEKEEYAGVLELDLSGIVSVTAVGLITTRMPDGSSGFSLLLIITAEFGSPIQLGYGFTLSGVGGLLGLNRTMRLEQLATGIRDGGINSIMFPDNVVANAPRIISDLKNYFPVEEDTFLIGPMVKIGWGTPNLVTVSLGVVIEIPGNIAILGVLKLALPDEDAALIVIQVNFMGAIEFDKERLWFFASLYESRILFITLEGDMGLLVAWGDNANFVLSVGGFHPAFNPPALPFGKVRRISVSILNTDFARIIVQGYFAVTSNSVQFGASVELFFGVDAFNIDGHLVFDALFRFSPFYFIISISASLSVKVFGIGLFSVRMRGSLEGPAPWYVEGTGSISLLFFDIDVDFSHTWGEEEDTALPPISVMPLLEAEYQKLENWRAVLPNESKLSVSLRSFEQGGADLVLHPVGSLRVSQRAVPLGVTIDKVGNQSPSDAERFDLTVSTAGLGERGQVDESFARGQYFDDSDTGLLSAPAFEFMPGGVELSVEGESQRAPQAVKRVLRYEKIVIDTHFRRFHARFHAWIGGLFDLFLNGNAMALSPLSFRNAKQYKPFEEKILVGPAQYGVADMVDNSPYGTEAASFNSYSEARDYLKQQVAVNPNLSKTLHVIPTVEMKQAA